MRKITRIITAICAMALLLSAALPMKAAASDYAAQPVATNEATGYKAYIFDQQDLLTDAEEEALIDDMMPVTKYGGAALVTDMVNAGTSKAAAER